MLISRIDISRSFEHAKVKTLACFVLLVLFFMSSAAFAEGEVVPLRSLNAPAPSSSSSGGSFIWLTLVTLMLAAVLVGLIAWMLRRNMSMTFPNAPIRVLAVQSVGPRERIVIAQVVGRVFVLGHTPTQVNLISELEPHEVAGLKSQPVAEDFATKLSTLLRKGPGA